MINLVSNQIVDRIKANLNENLILGPHEPTISKIRNLYLMEAIIKIPRQQTDLSGLKNRLIETVNFVKQQKEYRQTIVVFDVDPF